MPAQPAQVKGLLEATLRAQELAEGGLGSNEVEIRLMDEGFSTEDAAAAATDTITPTEVQQTREEQWADDVMTFYGIDARAKGPQGFWLLAKTVAEVAVLVTVLYFMKNWLDHLLLVGLCFVGIAWRIWGCAWEFYQDRHPFGG